MNADLGAGSAPRPSRRTIIRRAAAAGALAWTAPAIIDSLASPAAAASLSGCYRAEFRLDDSTGCGTYVSTTPNNGAGCVPTVWNNVTEFPDTITVTAHQADPDDPCLYTFSVSGTSGCTFDIRSIASTDHANNCVNGTLATNCQKLFFEISTFQPDRFKILLSCAGSVCAGGTACA